MICDVCSGVLKDCRNLIETSRTWYTMEESNFYRKSVSSVGDDADKEDDDYEVTTNDNDTGNYAATIEEEAVQQDIFDAKQTSQDAEDAFDSEHAISCIAETENSTSLMGDTTIGDGQTDIGEVPDRPTSTDSQSASSSDNSSFTVTNTGGRHALYGHHVSLSDLQAAARTGCQICWQVEHSMSIQPASASKHMRPVNSSLPQFHTLAVVNGSPEILFLHVFDSVPPLRSICTFSLKPQNGEWAAVAASQVISKNTASCESLRVAQQWIHDCSSGHLSCKMETRDTQWYPTRLLDLGDLNQEDLSEVRLISTASHSPKGHYTTLSHRWGDAEFLQLKHHNLENLARGIQIDKLPRTFREAMTFSKGLQIRYLWIDSLCIMQDDVSDWAFEASQMHLVYSNSHCNLSASDAQDSLQGLFRDRDPRALCSTEVDVCLIAEYTAENTPQKCLLTNEYLFYMSLVECSLNKRGWVFQERFLAPRVLHFCRDQLFWECRHHTACEQHQAGLDRSFYNNFFGVSVKVNNAFLEKDKASWYRLWQRLIHTYSYTSLTFPGDKLVAISGIAKMIRSHVLDEYVAGMWRKDLNRQLLWEASENVSRSPVYRAPSWSWASIDGRIFYADVHVRTPYIEVVDIHIEYATGDETGQINGGWLDLKGALRPVLLKQSKVSETLFLSIDDDDDKRSPRNGARLDDSSLDVDVILRQSAAAQHFCILAALPSDERDTPDFLHYYCFILLRLVNFEEGHYERIGLAKSPYEDNVQALMQSLNEEAKMSLPCLRYEDGNHTIRVI
ncbi:heterokaryon incompatibility protein-domain-containing protein [Boeremia exigua]|uniref:heterokaryon incompatibility protein-domain-containing protein n=1 Tax=Boeremia exigua TaxID=749465 RepID=UPI001E8D3307|nr:heterokaryon incompatibility protein-domain-containing protein [Boeremia exigua]KAH6637575.1 heterokaryon incompatibility protein-domain-containing protein [Boeremia exigua]